MQWLKLSVQASPRDGASWLKLATRVEASGFDTLYVGDHPGIGPAPFVALAAAAAVTTRVHLGTCVLNAGVWEPLQLASEVATLDVLSNGRALLGVGAGHTPLEWTATGRDYPAAGARVERMIELVQLTNALLAGDQVSHPGGHFTLVGAQLSDPRPVRPRVPLLVGGNGTKVLAFAAQHADIVGITGFGRTLADGHSHEVDWTAAGLRRLGAVIDAAANSAGRRPPLEALVQHLEITDDAAGAAERVATAVAGVSALDLLRVPFVWIGTVDQIRENLQIQRERFGIERYVIRAGMIDGAREVLGS